MSLDRPPQLHVLYSLAAGQEARVICEANAVPLTRPVKRSDVTPGRGLEEKSLTTLRGPLSTICIENALSLQSKRLFVIKIMTLWLST